MSNSANQQIQKSVIERTELLLQLGHTAARRADNLKIRQKRDARRARMLEIAHTKRLRARVNTALEGIATLSELGRSPNVQRLMDVSNAPITLWEKCHVGSPGGDMCDITHGYESIIELTRTEVSVRYEMWTSTNSGTRIDPESVYLSFAYARKGTTYRRQLRQIATAHPIDWEVLEFENASNPNNFISPEVLFEILVECADPEKLKKLCLDAL